VPLRWPWRKTEPAAPTVPSVALPTQRAAVDERRAVPPPGGLSGPPALTTDRRFGRELSGHRSLPPVIGQVARGGDLAPMMRPVGTRRSATHDGPGASYGHSSDMTLRPQRSPRPGASHDVEIGSDPGSHATLESPLPAPSVPNHIEAVSAGERNPAQTQGGTPQRSAMTFVPIAQRSAISEGLPPAGQLWLDEIAGPVPEVPAPAASSARPEPSTSATEARPRPAAASRVSQGAPATQRSPVAPATQRSPMAGPRRTVHSNARSTRRVGLGAPLARRSAPRDEARPTSPTSTRAPVSTGPRLSSAPPGPAPTSLSTSDDGAVVPLVAPEPGLELVAPAPRGATPVSPTSVTAPGTQASAAASPPALPHQRSARTTTSPITPPIHQRASARRSAAATPTAATPSTSSGKVRIDRSNEGAAAAAGMDANAFTAGDTIVMPSSHGQLDRGRGQALLAHELVHVGQQRRMGAGLPPEHSSAGQQLEREARSAESLVEHVSRSAPAGPDMPLASAGSRRSPAEASPSHSREVHHATELALASGQRTGSGNSDAIELPATPAPGDAPGPQRAPAAAAASPASLTATAGAKPGSDEEFEELARRMYERLRLRLKRELLLDRERSGFLADSR